MYLNEERVTHINSESERFHGRHGPVKAGRFVYERQELLKIMQHTTL